MMISRETPRLDAWGGVIAAVVICVVGSWFVSLAMPASAQPTATTEPKPFYALIGKPHVNVAADPGRTVAIEFSPTELTVHRGETFQVVVSLRSTSGVDELFTVFDFPFQFNGLELLSVQPLMGSDWMLAEFYDDRYLDGYNDNHDRNAYFTLWSYPLRFHAATVGGAAMLVLTFLVPDDAPLERAMVMCHPGGTYAVPSVYDDEIGAYNLATCSAYTLVDVAEGPPSNCPPNMLCNRPIDHRLYADLARCMEGPGQ